MARFFKQCYARLAHWKTIGLLVGHSGLLLGLRCDARYSRFYPEGLKMGGFKFSGDDAECSILVDTQTGPVGLGPPGVARLGQRN